MVGLRGNPVIFWLAYFYFGMSFFGKANIGLRTELESVPDHIV